MKIYISGPMTGIENYNAEAFNAAEKKINELIPSAEVVNPIKLAKKVEFLIQNPTYGDYMCEDLIHLVKCDMVVCLEGFEKSKGCEIEICIAEKSGIPVCRDINTISKWKANDKQMTSK